MRNASNNGKPQITMTASKASYQPQEASIGALEPQGGTTLTRK